MFEINKSLIFYYVEEINMEKVAEKRNEFKNIIINYSVDVLKLDKKSVVTSLSIPIPDPFSLFFI